MVDQDLASVRDGGNIQDLIDRLRLQVGQALSARGLAWAVGIPRHQKVYPRDVELVFPIAGRGRPRKRHVPNVLVDAVESCVDKGVTERAPGDGVSYAAFGVHYPRGTVLLAMAIGHLDGEMRVIDLTREDIDIEAASSILKRYRVPKIVCSDDVDDTPLAHAVAGVCWLLGQRLGRQ
jgi:hypothetical protein